MSRLSPNEALKSVWRRWAEVVNVNDLKSTDGPWGDSFQERNSFTDAQLLLTLLLPEGELPNFSISGQLSKTVADGLRELGAAEDKSMHLKLNNSIVDLLMDYFLKYGEKTKSTGKGKSTAAKKPSSQIKQDFTAPSRIDIERDVQQSAETQGKLGTGRSDKTRKVEVVDSYSISMILCLYVLLLQKRLVAGANPNADDVKMWNEIGELASLRLSAAMRGLLASFAVYSIDTREWEHTVRRKWPENSDVGDYYIYATEELDRIRSELSGLGEANLKSGQFFEFGWSWGALSPDDVMVPDMDRDLDKSVRDFSERLNIHAFKAPYFYFTISALDAIDVLKSEKVSAAEILNDVQLVLASRLQNLASLTKRYWAVIALARDAKGLWAVQQLPWIPADGEQYSSVYWNLYLIRLVYDRLPAGVESTSRAIKILQDLAARARITQAPAPRISDTQVISIHQRGQQLGIETSEGENIGFWRVNDFAPQLLKACANVLSLVADTQLRQMLMDLVSAIWEHLEERRDGDSSKYAWDSLKNAFAYDDGMEREEFEFWEPQAGLAPSEAKSVVGNWYFTYRVIEALVATSQASSNRPETAKQLQQLALQLLSELEWELVSSSAASPSDAERYAIEISKAKAAIEDRPAIAFGIASKLAMELAEL